MAAKTAIEFVTIGVYGFDADQFFRALIDHKVDTLCDIRRRRGVRGAEYAFANSQRLQAQLAALHIRYLHFLDLSPSTELRHQQEAADKQGHTARRQRAVLSEQFVRGYEQSVLADFDAAAFIAALGPAAHVVALLCVEREPAACHRSLLAAHLHKTLGAPVHHITPATTGSVGSA
jgi:uncharacterized protein (DUF488 family)